MSDIRVVLPSKGSLPDVHTNKSQNMALAFEKTKLYCEADQQGDKRETTNLSPLPGSCTNFYELGRMGCYKKALAGQVLMGGLWNLAIYGKYGKESFCTRSSWTMDPLLLKGFESSGLCHVPVLWFCVVGLGLDSGSYLGQNFLL